MTRTHTLALLAIAAVAGALASGDARGDSVVQFMTAKSLPDATVAVIDPESGTSTGTSGSDVNLAVGDIILFRFSVASAPASAVRGIQSYVTEYVPPGTELVGVRITDEAGNTIEPRRAGLALDGCSGGSNCNSVAGHQTGSIAQVYADTGVFFTTDPLPGSPVPVNQFLTLDNGITMNPEPRNIDPEIVQLLNDTSGTYFAHNEWDWDQAQAFGTASSAFANGDGNTPHLYGSPVAGPDTHYPFEATDDGSLGLDDVEGPWERVFYPGSQIGTGVGDIGSTSNMTRVGVETALGWDLTPATAVDATAVRFALGEAQVGEIRYVEVALRVISVPIDPTFGTGGGNVDCGEAFGSDISSKAANTGGATNPWPSFVAHPQCVFLRLKFDLTVDKALAGGSDTLNYTVFGKNLAVTPETNARVVVKYVESDQDFVTATPLPNTTAACPAPENNKTCLTWNLGTLAPSDEFDIDLDLGVGGTGGGTNVVVAQYLSNELTVIDPLGYSTTAMTVVQPTAAPRITLGNVADVTTTFAASPSNTWAVTGTVQNAGTTSWTSEDFTIRLPSASWGLRNAAGTTDNQITIGGVDVTCSTTGIERVCSRADAYAVMQSRTIELRLIVPAGLTPSLHELDIRTRGSQSVFGSFETEFHKALTVPVGQVRTIRPVLTCPIVSTAPSISGTSEEDAAIRVLFNLQQRGTGTASGAGAWTVTNYLPGFGEMYGGLEVRATAQVTGELRSEPSTSCIVVATRQCSDGFDNDGDTLIDFPADPGCTSSTDNDESNPPPPQCSDGIDNNSGGGTDWPADPSCTAPSDTTEDGVPACNDGVDNDGDGDTDFPADSDCASATDGTELLYRACQNGLDDDGDTFADFPDDPGCHSAFDDEELDIGSSTLDTRARLLLAVDSSGSMNWNTCRDDFTGGDGSTECAGADLACSECGSFGCDNTVADDSRLFAVKSGLSNVVAAFGEIEYSLMRFHQKSMEFGCPGPAAGQQSGGWQGGGAAPCGGGFAAGDVLVSFAQENEHTILDWMNHDSDYDGVAPIGTDFEIRGSGTTPLAGILGSAATYLDDVRADDLKVACRPYRVILVTDGAETCGGDPQGAAAALLVDGIPVHVIGFATPDPTVIANLDSIAVAGGTGGAIFVDDEAALSQAIADIIEDSILFESCNGLDDDCDTLIDEDFPDLGAPCDNGEEGACFATGEMVCAANEQTTECDAPDGVPGTESCNGVDDDCDSLVDEGLGPTCTCNPVPEICNGADDDCDSVVDEGTLPGVGDSCGPTIGECIPGALECIDGELSCEGESGGPTAEVCDLEDDDCDSFVDEVSTVCYEFATGCTLPGGTCLGICQTGLRGCDPDGTDGDCLGDVGPVADVCNGLDDDCDGTADEGLGLGDICDNGLEGDCFASGILVCDGLGGTVCTAPDIPPGLEFCSGQDEDCDGAIDEMLGSPVGDSCGGGGSCSVGTFQCILGDIVCEGSETGTAEECNGADDDCDMTVDEDVPGTGGDCVPPGFEEYQDIGECEFGHLECIGGEMDCQGYMGPSGEIPCNGIDEDCDGNDDVTCPTGQACVEDGCRLPCEPGEFPCGFGFVCEELGDGSRWCVPDPCLDVTCDPGLTCDQSTGECVDLCAGINCSAGYECRNGLCGDCYDFGCPAGELCLLDPATNAGGCVEDLCADTTCPAGEYCSNGDCVTVTDPCLGPCPDGQVCNPDSGSCVPDACDGVSCNQGEACNPFDGTCLPDPCRLIDCPADLDCAVGPDGSGWCAQPSGTPEEHIFAGGGGCAAGGGSAGTSLLVGLALLGLLSARRPRGLPRPRRGARIAASSRRRSRRV